MKKISKDGKASKGKDNAGKVNIDNGQKGKMRGKKLTGKMK
jgi:hypothetical protein